MAYKDDLKTGHWQKRKFEVVEKANWTCEDCGAGKEKQLQVHHTAYIADKKIWEHGDAFLMCLCDTCHKSRQAIENEMRYQLGRATRGMPPVSLDLFFWDLAKLVAQTDHNRMLQLMAAAKRDGEDFRIKQ